ncbi:MAG: hypothetical protein ABR521_10515 [Gaiellaceae bacterium]
MRAGAAKVSQPRRRSALRSGLFTGLSLAALSGTAAAVGALLAHKFGRTAETDGFLAAYGVYLVLVLAAQSFRVVVVPELTRAAAAGRLGSETRAYLIAFVLASSVLGVVSGLLRHPIADAITGSLPEESARVAAEALVYLVPAALVQLLAALASSALAARDDYGVSALGYSVGGVAGLVLFILLADAHGTIALAWAAGLNAVIAFGFPLAALLARDDLTGGAFELRVGARLWLLVQGSAVPIALQGLYLVCLRFAADLGVGSVTSFSYAYLIAAVFVAVSAASVALISSAPLTRRGLDAETAAAHVVHSSWLSLAVIAAAAGVFALVGGRVAGVILGDAFTGEVGRELGHLVAYLAPWMFASVAFTLTFPLVFVTGRQRPLVPVAVGAAALHVPLAWGLGEAFGLPGLAVALALSTLAVFGALLVAIAPRALGIAALGLGELAVTEAALAGASFGLIAIVVGGVPGALLGVTLYSVLLLAWRPRGLREAWAYLRALH